MRREKRDMIGGRKGKESREGTGRKQSKGIRSEKRRKGGQIK